MFCLAIYGNPGNGKTFAAKNLAAYYGVKLISIDAVILFIANYSKLKNENQEAIPGLILRNIKKLGINSNIKKFQEELELIYTNNENLFTKLYKSKLKDLEFKRNSNNNKLIGHNLGEIGDFLEPIAQKLVELFLSYIIKKDPFFIIEGYHLNEFKKFRSVLEKILEKIIFLGCFFKKGSSSYIYKLNNQPHKNLNDIIETLNTDYNFGNAYQSFSANEDSLSRKKIDKLRLTADLSGKTVLDLGSNEGFFSFECEKRGAKVLGIERSKQWFDLAIKRKKILSSYVNFINEDWSCLSTLNYSFDIVLFLASFHYIKGNQLEILKNIYNKLNDQGVLILELGLLDKKEGSFLIEEIKRPAGDLCQYTNRFTIEKLLTEARFNKIKYLGEGVNIIGDDIPRYVIKAIKIESAETIDSEVIKEDVGKNIISESPTTIKKIDKINLHNVENLLITIYNKNKFNKWFFDSIYKSLRLFIKK